jgi:hypothetical protein
VGLAGVGLEAPFAEKLSSQAGFFGYERQIATSDITDGASRTFAVIETAVDLGPWCAGGQATVRSACVLATAHVSADGPFGAKHKTDTFFRTNPISANVAFADASVRNLSSSVSPVVFRALATIAGGEEVGSEF